MKRIPLNIAVILAALMLTACVAVATKYQPTPATLAAADYGPYPENYEQLIRDHFIKLYQSPEKFRLRIEGKPRKDFMGDSDKDVKFVWVVNPYVNALNKYGTAAGEHEWEFIFRDGAILQAEDLTESVQTP